MTAGSVITAIIYVFLTDPDAIIAFSLIAISPARHERTAFTADYLPEQRTLIAARRDAGRYVGRATASFRPSRNPGKPHNVPPKAPKEAPEEADTEPLPPPPAGEELPPLPPAGEEYALGFLLSLCCAAFHISRLMMPS